MECGSQAPAFTPGNAGCKSNSRAAALQKLLREEADFAALLAGFEVGASGGAVF